MRKFIKTRVTRKQFEQGVELMLTPVEVDVRFLKPDNYIGFPFWNELQHLIWICGAEARGEQSDGIQAVAHVIMNRQRLQYAYFGLTIREVIHKCSKAGIYQFSAADSRDNNFDWIGECANSTFYKVAKAVVPVYTNQTEPTNPRMLYYHSSDIQVPKFFREKLSPCLQLGKHIFYLDVNIPDSHIIG